MGAAAVRIVKEEVERGRGASEALSAAIASMALDCLEAVTPGGVRGEQSRYLLSRTWHVVAAAEGGSASVLTGTEAEVAACVHEIVSNPTRFDVGRYPRELVDAVSPYLAAAHVV
ncbi:MAG: hypothetical protein Q4A01_10840 [Coriobacteriales bacterium]|nr:hypothetical protein [Coriobacteriales bacterium]